MSELTPTLDPNVPIGPEPERRSTREANVWRWIRHNLARTWLDAVLTVVAAVVVGYALFRLGRFLLVTARWEIVRVNLRRFMFGTYPTGELWRLVVVAVGAAFLIGVAVGAGIQAQRREFGPPPPRDWRRRIGDVVARVWPLLIGVVLLLSMTSTVLPTLAVIGTAAAAVAGRWFADRLPDHLVVVSLLGATAAALALVWIPNGALKVVVAVAVAAATTALVVVTARGERRPHTSVTLWLAAAAVLLGVSAVRLLTRPVGWDSWGGLMLNIFLAVAGITLCFPIGVLLALGRRAGRSGGSTFGGVFAGLVLALPFLVILVARGFDGGEPFSWFLLLVAAALAVSGYVSGRRTSLPLIRAVSVGYIELVRGMPLYVLLLISAAALTFFFPAGSRPPGMMVRAIVVITLFTAAYIAEIVRGGLQSLPKGQAEAAAALGLSPLKTTGLVVLPQALRNVIPAIVGQFISLLKDTTLVGAAMGATEALHAREGAMAQDAFDGQRLIPETVTFVSFVFWVLCITMSRESQRLEKKLGVGTR